MILKCNRQKKHKNKSKLLGKVLTMLDFKKNLGILQKAKQKVYLNPLILLMEKLVLWVVVEE